MSKIEEQYGKKTKKDNIRYNWQNDQYWTLPENVRKAIDVAKLKRKNSEFYYKLKLLNDKIHIFTSIFYSKMP